MKTLAPFVVLIAAVHLGAAEPPAPIQIPVGKSMVIDTLVDVERVAVAAAEVVDAVAISRREVLLNAKALGETRVLVWQRDGGRLTFDVTVQPSAARLEALRQRLHAEVGADVDVEQDEKSVILRGTVQNPVAVERAVALASALGQPVNLLNVATPPADPQILLKVRFADIDRAASTELGANFISTGAGNTPGRISTQQFSPPALSQSNSAGTSFNLSDALNIFLFRPDLNLGATIRALQAKNLVQILAEPNLLASAGKQASFLAGGEFPYPVVQSSGSGNNNVTIMFREFGIRINFTPAITPRGTIHLRVAPEVSSLDYANGLIYQGFNIPGLAVRRVQTEVELEQGQSFAIAGLLDNRVTDQFNKIPGLGNIPLFGKLFQSRALSRNKSELLVVVTPELVQPIPAGSKLPEVNAPQPFLKDGAAAPPDANPPASGRLPVEPQIPWELTGDGNMERKSPSKRAAAPPGRWPVADTCTCRRHGEAREMNSSAEFEGRSSVTVAFAIRDQALRQQVLEATRSLPAMVLDQDCPVTSQAELLASVARLRPAILLLGLSGLAAEPAEVMARIAELDSPPRIIAVNDSADAPTILKAMRSGAAEFVYPPFDGAFSEAFQRVAADCRKTNPAAPAGGRIIGFVSAKGGCGATTLACHSADYLHRSRRKLVLLADLDPASGMAGLLLQISPHYTVADVLQNLHRLDLTLWKGLVSTAPSGLDVIPAPPAPYDLASAARNMAHLMHFWRSQYEVTLLDLGHGFTPLLAALVEWIDVLAVVATHELPALRQAKLLVQGLTQRNHGTRRVRLVINRMPKRTEIQVPELERIMGFAIQTTLPNDYHSLAKAYAQPKLLEPASFLGGQIGNLAAALAEIAPEPARKNRRFWI